MVLLNKIWYFLGLTFRADVFWGVLPLALATILIIAYFERYKNEEMGWNTYFTNTLVLLFVSINLFRFIYTVDVDGAVNFIDHSAESLATVGLLCLGILVSKFNFSHLLPEKFTKYTSSPLTINIIAYAVILFVYSLSGFSWLSVASLLIIVVLLTAIFELIKWPLYIAFRYVKKEKEREELENVREQKYQIGELKRVLSFKKKKLKNNILRDIDKRKRQAIKEKKILRGERLRKERKR